MNFYDKEYLEDTAEVLKALGHPLRLRLVADLCSGEYNVKQIWTKLNLPQATVSQHLSVLKHKGILSAKREGVEVYYEVVHPLVKRLMAEKAVP